MREHGTLRILHFGLGEIGLGIARETARTARLRSVAAVDVDPAKTGRSLGDLSASGSTDVVVRATLAEALADGGGVDVAFHCSGSHLKDIERGLLELIEAGCNVVTTAEEVLCPYVAHPEAASRLDAAARRKGVTLFAAGVNPGFLLDRLPVYLSSMTLAPQSVRATRLVDLSRRRTALRRKMGVGQNAHAVRERTRNFSIGHAGFTESVQYVARAFGWTIGAVEQTLEPVVAQQRVERGGEVVEAGAVLGLAHTARAESADGHVISYSLTMRLDCSEPYDEIEITGQPPILVRFPLGLHGDLATLASAVNAATFVASAPAGLISQLATPTA